MKKKLCKSKNDSRYDSFATYTATTSFTWFGFKRLYVHTLILLKIKFLSICYDF